ncbi:hypothetical protein TCON_2057 [Astathelohania contejeani]|uniref:Uncharacterized protein n=1 Tax=Astathelohania contejeani TaxID=164912 RepID=A0ABQ7HX38_9MICR|nr:hypothetical protein TCON_2057 [Thelohania contejeani]
MKHAHFKLILLFIKELCSSSSDKKFGVNNKKEITNTFESKHSLEKNETFNKIQYNKREKCISNVKITNMNPGKKIKIKKAKLHLLSKTMRPNIKKYTEDKHFNFRCLKPGNVLTKQPFSYISSIEIEDEYSTKSVDKTGQICAVNPLDKYEYKTNSPISQPSSKKDPDIAIQLKSNNRSKLDLYNESNTLDKTVTNHKPSNFRYPELQYISEQISKREITNEIDEKQSSLVCDNLIPSSVNDDLPNKNLFRYNQNHIVDQTFDSKSSNDKQYIENENTKVEETSPYIDNPELSYVKTYKSHSKRIQYKLDRLESHINNIFSNFYLIMSALKTKSTDKDISDYEKTNKFNTIGIETKNSCENIINKKNINLNQNRKGRQFNFRRRKKVPQFCISDTIKEESDAFDLNKQKLFIETYPNNFDNLIQTYNVNKQLLKNKYTLNNKTFYSKIKIKSIEKKKDFSKQHRNRKKLDSKNAFLMRKKNKHLKISKNANLLDFGILNLTKHRKETNDEYIENIRYQNLIYNRLLHEDVFVGLI